MTKDGSVIYWYIDKENRIRSGKIMQYDPQTGKRIKNTSTTQPSNPQLPYLGYIPY